MSCRTIALAALLVLTGPAVASLRLTVAAQPRGPAVFVADGGRVSARLDGVPLPQVLRLLARAVPLTVTVRGSLPDVSITATLDDVNLEAAVKQLLRGYAYFLVYAEAAASSGPPARRLLEIVILSGGTAHPPGPIAAGSDASIPPQKVPDPRHAATTDAPELDALVHTALWSAEPDARAAALEAVAYEAAAAEGPEDHAGRVLTAALNDPDETVRERALETLKDTADAEALPVGDLVRLAAEDASPARRVQALELLAERAEAEAAGPLRRALLDPEPEVRERARELLEDLRLAVDPARPVTARP
jgi:HEAT repeat protein